MSAESLAFGAVFALGCAAFLWFTQRMRVQRLERWRLLSAIAADFGLALHRSPASILGEAEAFGNVGRRPMSVRYFEGGKYSPARMEVVVGLRMRLERTVFLFSGPQGTGLGISSRYERRPLGADPQGPLLVSSSARAADAVVAALSAGAAGLLRDLARAPTFYQGRLSTGAFEVDCSWNREGKEPFEALMNQLAVVAAAVEVAAGSDGLPYSPLAQRLSGGPLMGWLLAGMGVVVALIGLLPLAGVPRASIDDALFDVELAASTFMIGISMVLMTTLSAAERNIMQKSQASPGP